MNKKIKTLLLFSGGLDSILAVKILQNADIKVTAIIFTSAFFQAENAKKQIKKLKIDFIIKDISLKHFQIVKNPPSGYGKNLNPCFDCRALMLKTAYQIAQEKKFDFISTGEVLSQRPFSQNKNAFLRLEKITKLQGKIFRPLSAQLLKLPEIEVLQKINPQKWGDLNGRSRKKQLLLAQKFGLKDFPSPAGGCILTDPSFSKRGKELLKKFPHSSYHDFNLIRWGRFFAFEKAIMLIGRNKEDNLKLMQNTASNDITIEINNIPGPLTVIRFFKKYAHKEKNEIIKIAQEKMKKYAHKAIDKEIKFTIETI